jgi:hypothetical protein
VAGTRRAGLGQFAPDPARTGRMTVRRGDARENLRLAGSVTLAGSVKFGHAGVHTPTAGSGEDTCMSTRKHAVSGRNGCLLCPVFPAACGVPELMQSI